MTMAFIDLNPGINDLLNTVTSRVDTGFVHSTSNVEGIIGAQRQGNFTRQMMRWRTPAFGWVKMFLNPENFSINDKKDIETIRTKAGFIIQYAGEALTDITIRGQTGSAGIEGINILRAVYRAEQYAFGKIADELNRARIPMEEILSRGSRSDGTTPIQDTIDLLLNIYLQPFPTLASLAANTELYFQGELYRGFFRSFSVEESASQPGHFNYNINFTAYARQGVRRNFMPWHRQPYNPVGLGATESNPLSFRDDQAQQELILRETEAFTVSQIEQAVDTIRGRSTSSGSGSDGMSLQDINLEDFL